MVNVTIRPICEHDTENIIKWRNNPSVRKFFIDQNLVTAEIHKRWLENYVYKKIVYQFIIHNGTEKRDVGSIFLRDVDLVNKTAEYGIFIGEDDQRGKGIAYLASKEILDFGFNELKLDKIMLRVLKENEVAIKSYERIGFKHTNANKIVEYIHDVPQEIIFMDIDKENYRK